MADRIVVPLGPPIVDLTGVRAGDRNLMSVTITSNGAPVDLTGLSLSAQARVDPTSSIIALSAVIAITDSPGGKLTVRWPGDLVRSLLGTEATWKGVWDLQLEYPTEDPVTIVAGKFSAEMDVTRP